MKAEPYEAAKRRRSSKGIENSMELAPDFPAVCVDGTVLDPVPEGELGASDVPAGEAAGEAPLQLLIGGVCTLQAPGKAIA